MRTFSTPAFAGTPSETCGAGFAVAGFAVAGFTVVGLLWWVGLGG
ncbi:hypothetical protein [Pseudonocardia spinosispora]|nr:hypothetical protein [Pseudonocardia spinosispora]